MGLGTYLSDRLFGQDKESQRDDKLKREQLFLAYYPELSQQYNPQELASMQRRFVEGDGLNLPSMRSEPIPQEEGVDVPERSTLKPIESINNKRKVYYDMTNKQPITPESIGLPSSTEIKPIYSSKKQTIKNSEKPIQAEKQNKGSVPRGAKKLTKETASQFLQKANGDKELARKLAREAGYNF